MSHWTNKYVGKIYIPGVYDCGSCVEEINNKEFNRQIYLPSRYSNDLHILTDQLNENKHYYATQVDMPFEGDTILMKSITGNIDHIGTIFFISNVQYVIHNVKGIGSVVVNRVRDLKRFGFIPQGYYRWK